MYLSRGLGVRKKETGRKGGQVNHASCDGFDSTTQARSERDGRSVLGSKNESKLMTYARGQMSFRITAYLMSEGSGLTLGIGVAFKSSYRRACVRIGACCQSTQGVEVQR